MKTRILLLLFLALMASHCGAGTETPNPGDNQEDSPEASPASQCESCKPPADNATDNQTTLLDDEWDEENWDEE